MLINIFLGLVVILFFVFGFAWFIAGVIIKQPRELRKNEWEQYALWPQNITFKSTDGLKLSGVFIQGNNRGTIILLHGYGRCKEQMLPQASFLNKAGFNILMFDFRASGESEGKFITFGNEEKSDLSGAVQYLRQRGNIEMDKIGLLGFSMGGAVALLTSSDLPEAKAIVINSSFAHFKSVIKQNFNNYFKGLPFFPMGLVVLWLMKMRTGTNYPNIDPILQLPKLKARPLMVIHGAQDKRIPVEDAFEMYHQAPWLKEFWLVKEAAHEDVYSITKEMYEQKVIQFFNKYLLNK